MADISQIKTPDGTVYNIKDNVARIPYLTCSNAASTAAKTTTLVSGSFGSDDLVEGARVIVKFSNSNTASTPTLSVNGTTAKSIRRYGSVGPGSNAESSWQSGSMVMFVYDGTYWVMEFSNVYTLMSESEMQTGTAATLRTLSAARLKAAVQYHAPVTSVNGNTGAVTVQETLVSGTNIKTINNTSILGSGDISVGGGGGGLTIDDIYPVGSIYISTSSTNPGTLFSGTTWTQIQDTFLLAAGSTYTAGDTGGEATHKLIEGELPSITGSFNIRSNSNGNAVITASSGKFSHESTSSTATSTNSNTSKAATKVTYAFGSGNAHNNMPPYLAVYVWERTA